MLNQNLGYNSNSYFKNMYSQITLSCSEFWVFLNNSSKTLTYAGNILGKKGWFGVLFSTVL